MPTFRLILLLLFASCAPTRALRPGEVRVVGLAEPGQVRLDDGRVLPLEGLSTPKEWWGSLEEIDPKLVAGIWKAEPVEVSSISEESCERWRLQREGEWLSTRLVRAGSALASFRSHDVVEKDLAFERLLLATRSAQERRVGPWRALPVDARRIPDSIASVALPLHSKEADYDYDRELTEIAALGASWVSLLVVTRQDRVDSSSIPLESAWTPADERVVETIERSKALGLRVLLMPLVLIEHMEPEDWRGTLAPKDPESWWQDYEIYLQHMADVAHRGGADALCIGSEFASLELETSRWAGIAERVRLRFGGLLTYSANWDHFDEIAFWPHLDFAGMTAYFELSESESPSFDELVEGWRHALAEVERLNRVSQQPVFLTEVGIPSARGATAWPWDYTREAAADPELQREAFAAFAQVFYPRERPAFSGFLGQCFYDWWGLGGEDDTGYTARHKPAAEVWREVAGLTRSD
ncbi:MAG: hypothetical protein AAF368_00690 [Planctomycetota bacterium]